MPLLNDSILPRRLDTRSSRIGSLRVTHEYIQTWVSRTRRLLSSPGELERECQDPYRRLIWNGSAAKLSKELSAVQLQQSCNRAIGIEVDENELTREFLDARDQTRHARVPVLASWSLYKERCKVRHYWGQLLSSNLDWDWDTWSALAQLFDIGKPRV